VDSNGQALTPECFSAIELVLGSSDGSQATQLVRADQLVLGSASEAQGFLEVLAS